MVNSHVLSNTVTLIVHFKCTLSYLSWILNICFSLNCNCYLCFGCYVLKFLLNILAKTIVLLHLNCFENWNSWCFLVLVDSNSNLNHLVLIWDLLRKTHARNFGAKSYCQKGFNHKTHRKPVKTQFPPHKIQVTMQFREYKHITLSCLKVSQIR